MASSSRKQAGYQSASQSMRWKAKDEVLHARKADDGRQGNNYQKDEKFVPKGAIRASEAASNQDRSSGVPKTASLSNQATVIREGFSAEKTRISSDGAVLSSNSIPRDSGSSIHSSSASRSMTLKGSDSKRSLQKSKLLFVPYLPQDENGLDVSESQVVTDLLNKELSTLLKLKPREFWQEVASNNSLHRFLDSYLHFRRRWYDIPSASTSGAILGDEELSRRVFMALLRMSSNQDPGVRSSDSFSAQEHAAILHDKGLFALPKVMDICALYGHDNADLTYRLVSNVIKSQPAYRHGISEAVPQILNMIDTVHDRCHSTIEAVEHASNKTNSRLKDELLEVIGFMHDTVATLDAFIEVYPPAAAVFLSAETPTMQKNLFSSLASIHDSLVPILRKGFSAVEETSQGELYLKTLRERLVKFTWDLLSKSYLGDAMGRNEGMDSSLKGQHLLQAVVSLAAGEGLATNGSLLHCLANDYDLLGNIQRLFDDGSILLDDNQYAQMVSLLPEARPTHIEETKQPSSHTVEDWKEQEAAIRQSQIAQIKDLFPGYGDGFLSACLDAYDYNPEAVIQHILEGTLHPELSSLDVTLQVKPVVDRSKPTTKDKGKAKVIDEGQNIQKSSSKVDSTKINQGRYIRRNQNPDEDASNLLDVRDHGSSSQTARLAMQIIYDDEYDDSFDDLDMNVGDAGLETDSLVNLVSRRKVPDSLDYRPEQEPVTGMLPTPRVRPNASYEKPEMRGKGNDGPLQKSVKGDSDGLLPTPKVHPSASHQKSEMKGKGKKQDSPQFYVKDGKNYSYKVAGSVAASSAEEAEAMKKQEAELIHGLGRGGNVPYTQDDNAQDEDPDEQDDDTGGLQNPVQQGGAYGRGTGKPPFRRKYVKTDFNRKDMALKKHLTGLKG